jgi:type IV pilus assembly protein PilE
MKRTAGKGFTLIELMIAVGIVAILASVAYPAYTSYVRRGQLAEAFATLPDYRVKLEQYYQDNRYYGVAGCVDTNTPSWGAFPITPPAGGLKYFQISCALTNGGQGYTLTATGNGTQTTGYTYTLDQSATRKTTLFAGATASANCWATKSASACDN